MNNPKVSFPVSVPIGSSRSGVSLGAGGKESRVCSVLSPITEPPLLLTRLRERGRRKNCFVATCSFYNCCKNVLATKHRCKAHVLHPCGFLSCGTRSLGPTQPAQGVLELVLSLSLLPLSLQPSALPWNQTRDVLRGPGADTGSLSSHP